MFTGALSPYTFKMVHAQPSRWVFKSLIESVVVVVMMFQATSNRVLGPTSFIKDVFSF